MADKGKVALITGVGIGSGLMYLFDPVLGRRRRALVRGKAKQVKRSSLRIAKSVDKSARQLAGRTQGMLRQVQTLSARIAS
ncbi:MAG TPA: hypothetical protein VKR61_08770 [Bryobacteraceae bacterium]|nr:hypothetical protein [Bryobacteraceae bacterium]